MQSYEKIASVDAGERLLFDIINWCQEGPHLNVFWCFEEHEDNLTDLNLDIILCILLYYLHAVTVSL